MNLVRVYNKISKNLVKELYYLGIEVVTHSKYNDNKHRGTEIVNLIFVEDSDRVNLSVGCDREIKKEKIVEIDRVYKNNNIKGFWLYVGSNWQSEKSKAEYSKILAKLLKDVFSFIHIEEQLGDIDKAMFTGTIKKSVVDELFSTERIDKILQNDAELVYQIVSVEERFSDQLIGLGNSLVLSPSSKKMLIYSKNKLYIPSKESVMIQLNLSYPKDLADKFDEEAVIDDFLKHQSLIKTGEFIREKLGDLTTNFISTNTLVLIKDTEFNIYIDVKKYKVDN